MGYRPIWIVLSCFKQQNESLNDDVEKWAGEGESTGVDESHTGRWLNTLTTL